MDKNNKIDGVTIGIVAGLAFAFLTFLWAGGVVPTSVYLTIVGSIAITAVVVGIVLFAVGMVLAKVLGAGVRAWARFFNVDR